ncbi:MAG: chromosomal replication initiator protein DnaA [Clostridia bacterium]|nr:chromosomal replication initiator protein DnaA [Clostridia bacterium]MBQ8029851.1 chromosomal replication initiator protein DnaA [Clostridia bacterium]
MDSFEEIWEEIKSRLQLSVSTVAFNVWLNPLEFISFKNDTITLAITEFKRELVIDRFSSLIEKACEDTVGFPVNVNIIIAGGSADSANETNNSQTKAQKPFSVGTYDYTFDNFIIGSSNRFAHAAAVNVAEHPGEVYNPLFIYGHSGLGKTHLLSAIMNEIKLNHPNYNIIYTSGEHFTNELINCLRTKTNYAFHEKYRNCDVLLVDDIQFIADKESTQEEFFHTFVALRDAGKQIVLTSDRPPKEMFTLKERLVSRFESGLIADITPPSLETRMAIVKKKADDLSLELSDEVITFVAENIKKNIRQLEGAVKKIKAYYEVEATKPNIAIAKRAISDICNDNQPVTMTVENVINEVARTFDVSVSDIRSDKRVAKVSQARQVAIYIISEVTNLSLKDIGKEFGNKHYTTIIYSLNEIKSKIETNVTLKATVDDIIKNINE